MLTLLAAVLVLAVALVSLWGWGALVHRLCHGDGHAPWPYLAALGLAALALVGGPLNLLHLAHPVTLDALVAAGLFLAAWPAGDLVRARREAPRGLWRPAAGRGPAAAEAAPRLVVLGAALFLAATLLPAGVFNHHDDMHKYMVPPLRMLATGTLGGNPFETTGMYSLGLQSFFHAFVVRHFPLTYLNGFDAVLCFLLTGLLLDALGRRVGIGAPYRALGLLVLVAINPQYVNISSVYSGSVAAVGMAWAGLLAAERLEDGGPFGALRAGVPLGLFAALLAGLKATHVPFAGMALALILVGLALLGPWRRALAVAGGAVAGAVVLLGPWLATYASSYLSILAEGLRGAAHRAAHADAPAAAAVAAGAGGGAPGAARPTFGVGELFTPHPIYFGHTTLEYTLVVTVVLGACLFLAFRWARHRRGEDLPARALSAVALATGLTAATYYVAIPLVYHTGQGVRYLSPFLALAAALCLFAVVRAPGGGPGAPGVRGLWAATCMGFLVGIFASATVARAVLADQARTLVSFRLGAFNVQYHAYAFGDEVRKATRAAQDSVPVGAPVLAWTATPFDLDFARNRVYTIPDPDFSMKHLKIPFFEGPEAVRAFLRARGIDHVLWEYNGPGMRSDESLRDAITSGEAPGRGRYTLQFKDVLRALAQRGPVLFDNGRIVAFALEAPGAVERP